MLKKLTAMAILLASPAMAQEVRDSVSPAIGKDAIASVGEPVYEKSHYTAVPAFVIADSFDGHNLFAHIVLMPGQHFIQIPAKNGSKVAVKACHAATYESFQRKLYDACLYDDDGDGTFDRYGGNEVQGGKKLPHPFAYKRSDYIEPTPDALKQIVTYLGSTKDTLRLSYREFVNDMARPAFTEEYTFPLGASYPQPVAFKGVHLTVTGVDGAGIHYRIDGAK